MRSRLPIAVVAALLAAAAAQARNIDLVTLPPRNTVQLTIYNSEDLTLVKETRSITFKKGLNRLQFSWAGTLIDPTSVYFRPLEHEGEIEVLDTTFPADRPQVLIWEVDSQFEGQAKVEVSYFTSGIAWSADYVMITNPEETQMACDGYVTVVNNSGEDYEGAQVRLVVGVINLVEKIQQLARGRMPAKNGDKRLQRGALLDAIQQADVASDSFEDLGPFASFKRAPRIVKEGLSEYFIFTVEGEQTVKNGWAQRMVSFKARQVPFEILYRLREHQYGPRPVRFFILANDEEHKMGESPLPDGVIRVFRDNGKDGLAYYTTQATKYIPIKEKVELNVGTDDELVYERVVLDLARSDFIFDHSPPVVVGWNEKRKWQEEVRNYRAKAIKVEIRHVLPGHVEFAMEDSPKLFDYHTVEYVVQVPARQKQKWTSEGLFHLGRNAKQDRVRLGE
ncbi:MAG: hypothetical protein NTX40_01375 [Planctomycetota bacterium]|nr:hypothetical protein [Planctomycetota bacterium]